MGIYFWSTIMKTTTGENDGKKLEFDLADYSNSARTTLARKAQAKRRKIRQICVGFGAATSTALLGGTGLEAGIIYSGPQDITLAPGVSSSSTARIDLDGNHLPDFEFYFYNSGNVFGSSSRWAYGLAPGNRIATTGSSGARNFNSNDLIGTPGSLLGSAAESASLFRFSGFMGVQLDNGNFGWIQVKSGSEPKSLTIVGWAYEDSGQHLTAGAVPEPTSAMLMGLGLMAMGAAGVRELRRRKRQATA